MNLNEQIAVDGNGLDARDLHAGDRSARLLVNAESYQAEWATPGQANEFRHA
jgi:hypothetical protein